MRPFKEVILFNNISSGNGHSYRLYADEYTNFKIKQTALHILWRGSIQKFISDFELPTDSVISTKESGQAIGDKGDFVTDWDWTTLNFKFNYHIWYNDYGNDGCYVLGSNNTINLTIPNVLVFNGNQSNNNSIEYSRNQSNIRIYNPNIFPLLTSITSFSTSNKTDNFQAVHGSGNDSLCYLIFRYGVGGDDIQICLQTKDSPNFQVNSKPLIMPYASLTFTGFNKVKKLRG